MSDVIDCADSVPPLNVNRAPSSTVSDVPSVSVPLTVRVELSSVREYATAVPLTVTADELLMTAPSVESAPTPDSQSAASDQSPDVPVIQYCCRRRRGAPIDERPAVVVAGNRDGVARYAAADVVDELLTVGLVDRQRRAAVGRGTRCDPGKINRVANDDILYRSRECGGRVELERGGIPVKNIPARRCHCSIRGWRLTSMVKLP